MGAATSQKAYHPRQPQPGTVRRMFPARAPGGLMGGDDMTWDSIGGGSKPASSGSSGPTGATIVLAVLLMLSLLGNGYGAYHLVKHQK